MPPCTTRFRLARCKNGFGSNSVKLFGNRNIGNHALTNMQVGGCLAVDQTYVLMAWYARTNVTDVCRFQGGAPYRGEMAPPSRELIRAWDAWAHSTTVVFVLGTRPVLTRPLAELMGPRAFGNAHGHEPNRDGGDRAILAERMWERYRNEQYASAKGTRDEHEFPRHQTFRDIPEAEQEIWLAAAGVYPFNRPVIIPVRQNFSVTLASDSTALAALLKVLPENIAPRPLVWVHLDGLMTRDVA